jgi:hypothetical protein
MTPLFSALSYALSEGFRDDDPGSRHLVVISDGDDYVQERQEWERSFLEENEKRGALAAARAILPKLVFLPPWPPEDAEYNSDLQRGDRAELVRKGTKNRSPNSYLFDLSEKGELAPAAALAGLSKPIAAKKAADLANEVLQQMGVLDYTLDDRDESTDWTGRTTKTEQFTLPIGSYELKFTSHADSATPLQIGGGEALEVNVVTRDSRPGFEFVRQEPPLLDRQARGAIPLDEATLDPIFQGRLRFFDVQCRAKRAPQGSRDADRCTFELMFHASPAQYGAAQQFTPRPVEIWAQIAPDGSSGPGNAAYVFCNPFPKPGTRAPVYELVTPRWPSGAARAQVAVWIRMQPTQLKDALVDSSFDRPKPLAGSLAEPGVQFQFAAAASQQGPLVKIIELLGQSTKPPAWHFVIPSPNQDLTRVSRTYFDTQVEHEFQFAAGNVADAERRRFIAVPIESWKKLAVGLQGDQPLIVRVPE